MKKAKLFLVLCGILLIMCSCGKKDVDSQDATAVTPSSENVAIDKVENAVEQTSAAQSNVEQNSDTEKAPLVNEEILSKLEELVTSLDGSNWSGTDAQGNAYLVSLNNNQISYSVHNAEGESKYEGEYSLDATGKLIFENEEFIKALKNAEVELLLDGADTYLKVGDVYLTSDTIDDYEERLRNLDLAALAAEYMSTGHCWLACVGNKVVLLYFDGQSVQMKYISKDGDKIVSEVIDADWSLKKGDFAFYDFSGKRIEDFDWTFEDEGDLKIFTITDEQDGEITFYELEKDSIEAGEELAESYLENKQSVEEVEDLSKVLVGYEGVSIVDAFVAAGLDPSFDNRAIFAEKFQITDYKGTAEQNLFLLEAMGGVIK